MGIPRQQQPPSRSALLLLYDIEFQKAYLEQLQRQRQQQQRHLDDCETSTDKETAVIAKTKVNPKEIAIVPTTAEVLTSINQLYNSLTTTNAYPDSEDCIGPLLCRLTVPLIAVTQTKDSNSRRNPTTDKNCHEQQRQLLAVLDEPINSTCTSALAVNLRIHISCDSDDFFGSPSGSKSLITFALNQLIPLGSTLLVQNPATHFNPATASFEYDQWPFGTHILVLQEKELLGACKLDHGIQWEHALPSKYTQFFTSQSNPRGRQCIQEESRAKTCDHVDMLWSAHKYTEALQYIESLDKDEQDTSLLAKARRYDQQATFGQGYPISSWLTQLEQQQKHPKGNGLGHLDCAEYKGPVTVVTIPGKGRGLVATEFICAGSLVLACKAFVISFVETELSAIGAESGGPETPDESDAFSRWTDVLNANKIAQRLLENPRDGVGFYKLYAGAEFSAEVENCNCPTTVDMARILGIVKYNGFVNMPRCNITNRSRTTGGTTSNNAARAVGPFAPEMTSGLWLLPSYINHSCSDSNVFWRIWGDVMLIRAFRDIKPGDEILMSYRGALYNLPYTERRRVLFRGMGFEAQAQAAPCVQGAVGCGCRLCKMEVGLPKRKQTELNELLEEVRGFDCDELLRAGKPKLEFYRLQLEDILQELRGITGAAIAGEIGDVLQVYLYQPLKTLAMVHVLQGDYEGAARILEECHHVILDRCGSDVEKSVGCAFDLLCALLKLRVLRGCEDGDDSGDPKLEAKVQHWFNMARKNIGLVYGEDQVEDVLELLLQKYKISRQDIYAIIASVNLE